VVENKMREHGKKNLFLFNPNFYEYTNWRKGSWKLMLNKFSVMQNRI
jgi:hypothetical protein